MRFKIKDDGKTIFIYRTWMDKGKYPSYTDPHAGELRVPTLEAPLGKITWNKTSRQFEGKALDNLSSGERETTDEFIKKIIENYKIN